MVEEMKNLAKISDLINEIENEFDEQKTFLEKSMSRIKNSAKLQQLEFESAKIKYDKKYNNLKNTYNKLLDEKNYNLKVIANDDDDIVKIEGENNKLRNQIEKQEIINFDTASLLEKQKNMALDLKKKIDSLTKINHKKENKLISKVEISKKYLGLDFKVTEGNKIKVIFDKLCKDDLMECYVVFDLENRYSIVDIYPRVTGVEAYAMGLKDKTRFFDLIRAIRKEFVKEFCK